MPTKIQQLLDQLSENTLTLSTTRDYLANPDIVSYITRTQREVTNIYSSLKILDIEVRDIAIFFLNLLDVPSRLQGVLLTEYPVTYMLDMALSGIKPGDEEVQAVKIVKSIWFDVLSSTPKKVLKFYNQEPNYESCPLMTFHTTAYKAAMLPNKTAPLYVAYAFKLHTDIRFNQTQKIDFTTHLAYVRPARYFFEELSTETKAMPHHPKNKISSNYVKELAAKLLKRGIDKKTVLTYIKLFRELIRRKTIKPHPRISSRTSHNMKIAARSLPPDGDSAASSAPQFFLHSFKIDPPTDPYALLDFVDDIEFEHVSISDNSKLLTMPEDSNTYKNYMDYIHIRNHTFFWDMQYLNLFHLSVLYEAMDQALKKKKEDICSIVLFLYFLIHTGIKAEKLLGTVPVNGDISSDTVGLQLIDGRYYLLNPRIVPPNASGDNAGCMPTSNHVHIPIPKIIADMLPVDVLNRKHLFSFFQGKHEIHLSIYDINRFLDKVNSAYSVYEMSITLDHIEHAFLPLYSSRYGLDPVMCCHISGQDRHKLYGSQLHYIYIPHLLLANAYLKIFSLMHRQIVRNLHKCLKQGLFSGKLIDFPAVIEPVLDNKSGITGYGSSSTPTLSVVRNLSSHIIRTLREEINIITRHNLFVCNLFLGIQYSTGYRPRRRQIIPWAYYNENSGVLIVRDKDSADHHEQRILPIPKTLRSQLATFRKGLPHLKDFTERNLIISDQSDMFSNVLFLIDDSGRFVDFTPDGMLQVLQKAKIDYPFPMNMPRHYLRYHLYHSGISNDLSDIWMGHQRDGREMLNITSATIPENAFSMCLHAIEEMLLQIGFTDVEYLPA